MVNTAQKRKINSLTSPGTPDLRDCGDAEGSSLLSRYFVISSGLIQPELFSCLLLMAFVCVLTVRGGRVEGSGGSDSGQMLFDFLQL